MKLRVKNADEKWFLAKKSGFDKILTYWRKAKNPGQKIIILQKRTFLNCPIVRYVHYACQNFTEQS